MALLRTGVFLRPVQGKASKALMACNLRAELLLPRYSEVAIPICRVHVNPEPNKQVLQRSCRAGESLYDQFGRVSIQMVFEIDLDVKMYVQSLLDFPREC